MTTTSNVTLEITTVSDYLTHSHHQISIIKRTTTCIIFASRGVHGVPDLLPDLKRVEDGGRLQPRPWPLRLRHGQVVDR